MDRMTRTTGTTRRKRTDDDISPLVQHVCTWSKGSNEHPRGTYTH